MNIMHYSLGFPPFRSGGMIKYCMDLMEEEYNKGNNIYMLWPGKLIDSSSKTKIKIHKDYIYNKSKIHSVELINPLPIPLLNGINHVEYFMVSKDREKIKKFFLDNTIDILHVHTLMGLPIELIDVCKELRIKTIFTTHDYFGICPKWGLEKNGIPCVDDHNCMDCEKCNLNALSFNKMKFLQSSLYKNIKENKIVKWLRKNNNSKLYVEEIKECNTGNAKFNAERYCNLRNFYIKLLEEIDIIHFNSKNTKEIYFKYVKNIKNFKIINLSTSSIKDNRRYRATKSIVRFGYLGPITKHKGYFFLKKICDELYQEKLLFELHIYAETEDKNEYLKKHKAYKYNELDKVMDEFDLLIVPSQWFETYGFTVIEALSYGIPVVVTENVGAKDIIDGNNGIIVKTNSSDVKNVLKDLIQNKNKIDKMNNYIVNMKFENMEEHVNKILNLYD